MKVNKVRTKKLNASKLNAIPDSFYIVWIDDDANMRVNMVEKKDLHIVVNTVACMYEILYNGKRIPLRFIAKTHKDIDSTCKIVSMYMRRQWRKSVKHQIDAIKPF
jgi:hypothetical protein